MQEYYRTSYDIINLSDAFFRGVNLADQYNSSTADEFEDQLFCHVVSSSEKVQEYFKKNGIESKTIDLKAYSESYQAVYKNFLETRGYSEDSIGGRCGWKK